MRLLPQPFVLEVPGSEPVHDLEALCWSAADTRIRAWGLNDSEQEDLISYLFEVALRQAKRYDVAKDRAAEKGLAPTVSDYLFVILRNRCVDWSREYWEGSRAKDWQRPVELDDADREQVKTAAVWQRDFEEILTSINIPLLTPGSQDALVFYAKPMYEQGKTMDELAEFYATPKRLISKKLKLMRVELERRCAIAA